MCKNKTRKVLVKIPDDLSCNGFAKLKYKEIDSCIAPIVNALQRGGIDMRGSCCGHGKDIGNIHLQDGRALLIIPPIFKKYRNTIIFDDKFRKDIKKLVEKYIKKVKNGV